MTAPPSLRSPHSPPRHAFDPRIRKAHGHPPGSESMTPHRLPDMAYTLYVRAGGRYLHTQVGWLLIVLVGGTLVGVSALLLFSAGLALALPVAVFLALVLACFGWLTVRVDESDVMVRFGVGLIRKRIPLAQVRSFRVVRNKWWYGWGIRFTPEGTLWNVSGLGAVELTLDGPKKFRIGSDEPEALEHALVQVLGTPRALSAQEHATAERGARRVWLVLVALAFVLLSGLGLLLWAEARPPRASADAAFFRVSSAVYSAEVPLADITDVELTRELPRIVARTNGTGLGRTLRGNFRLDRLGDGKLFLTSGSPPYLVVKTRDSYVIVGYSDPERTRDLHRELLARWRKGL